VSIKRSRLILGALLVMMVPAAPAVAHHSFAMFDNTKTITVSGKVKEFQFTNPHAWLLVTDSKGAVWSFEFGGGPSALIRAGINKSSLAGGEAVTVTAQPLRDGRNGGNLMLIKKSNGVELSPRLGPPPAAK